MAYEVLSQIKTAETNAEKVKKDAITRAKKIIEDAQRTAYKLENEEIEKITLEAERIVSCADDEVKDILKGIQDESIAKKSQIEKTAHGNMSSTVERLVERIVER